MKDDYVVYTCDHCCEELIVPKKTACTAVLDWIIVHMKDDRTHEHTTEHHFCTRLCAFLYINNGAK